MWKILMGQIREEIYDSLISRKLFSLGTEELLYIDQRILKESKTKRKNLAMSWIDHKKAYDMVH